MCRLSALTSLEDTVLYTNCPLLLHVLKFWLSKSLDLSMRQEHSCGKAQHKSNGWWFKVYFRTWALGAGFLEDLKHGKDNGQWLPRWLVSWLKCSPRFQIFQETAPYLTSHHLDHSSGRKSQSTIHLFQKWRWILHTRLPDQDLAIRSALFA